MYKSYIEQKVFLRHLTSYCPNHSNQSYPCCLLYYFYFLVFWKNSHNLNKLKCESSPTKCSSEFSKIHHIRLLCNWALFSLSNFTKEFLETRKYPAYSEHLCPYINTKWAWWLLSNLTVGEITVYQKATSTLRTLEIKSRN